MSYIQKTMVYILFIVVCFVQVNPANAKKSYTERLYYGGYEKKWQQGSWSLYVKGQFEHSGCLLILSPTAYSDKTKKAFLVLDPFNNNFKVDINDKAENTTLLFANLRIPVKQKYYFSQNQLKKNPITKYFKMPEAFYITWLSGIDKLYRSVRFETKTFLEASKQLARYCLVLIDPKLTTNTSLLRSIENTCKKKYRENFIKVKLTYDRLKCKAYSRKQISEKKCRKKHGKNFYKVELEKSLFGKNRYKCLALADYCKLTHGKNFKSVNRIGKSIHCTLYMSQKKFDARERCKKEYTSYFRNVKIVDGNYTCVLNVSYERYQAIESCKREYKEFFKNVEKRGGIYRCILSISYREFQKIKHCKNLYKDRYISVKKSGSSYYCVYRDT